MGSPGGRTRVSRHKCKSRAQMRVTVLTVPGTRRLVHSALAQRRRGGKTTVRSDW